MPLQWAIAIIFRSMVAASLSRRLADVDRRLARAYGRPTRTRRDPLDTLVETVLSQHTSDLNSGRAFASLKQAFPSWSGAAVAPAPRIERAIRVGGLARVKSRTIKRLLGQVKEREGRYDLSRLRRLRPPAARETLRGLTGVGPKTRACVLLFACGQAAFPVDTHVHRIVRRLGLVDGGASAERAQDALEPLVSRAAALPLHLNLIRLGREVCKPRDPQCGVCPLRGVCAYARSAA
jgi:endonuclease-3